MAETAYSVLYRDEWIHGFEPGLKATLRSTVTTEAMVQGRQAVFLVAESSREAVTRGSNGLIPASVDDLTQSTVTLEEVHDKPQKTQFNIFAGQSDQRAIMQATSRRVINRAIDRKIIDALAQGTQDVAGPTFSKGVVNKSLAALLQNSVPMDGNIHAVVTPAAWMELTDLAGWSSQDYVADRPLMEGMVEVRRWMGINWRCHDLLPGMGTNAAKCFMYHRDSVGHAYASSDIQVYAGYDEQDDYSWCRTTIYHGSLRLQNKGIVVITHDDSQYVAT